LLDFLVETKGKTLHFGKVTAALLRRHGLADGDEMPEHLRLALSAEFAQLSQFFLCFGGDIRAVAQRGLNFRLFSRKERAHFCALRQVSLMQLPDARHFGVAQMKLVAQPA